MQLVRARRRAEADGATITGLYERVDRLYGEQRTIEDGKLKSQAWYENGERVWDKEFHPSGKLAKYNRKFADGYGELTMHEDGKVYRLRCAPSARDDKELRTWCGFDAAMTAGAYIPHLCHEPDNRRLASARRANF